MDIDISTADEASVVCDKERKLKLTCLCIVFKYAIDEVSHPLYDVLPRLAFFRGSNDVFLREVGLNSEGWELHLYVWERLTSLARICPAYFTSALRSRFIKSSDKSRDIYLCHEDFPRICDTGTFKSQKTGAHSTSERAAIQLLRSGCASLKLAFPICTGLRCLHDPEGGQIWIRYVP